MAKQPTKTPESLRPRLEGSGLTDNEILAAKARLAAGREAARKIKGADESALSDPVSAETHDCLHEMGGKQIADERSMLVRRRTRPSEQVIYASSGLRKDRIRDRDPAAVERDLRAGDALAAVDPDDPEVASARWVEAAALSKRATPLTDIFPTEGGGTKSRWR